MDLCRCFADGSLSTRHSKKGAAHCSFSRALSKWYFGKGLLINFTNTIYKIYQYNLQQFTYTLHFSQFLVDRKLSTRRSTKGTARCHIYRALWNNYFGKALLIHFISTWINSLKHCIFADFLLIVSYVQGFLRKKPFITPFVEDFRTTTLGKFHW